MSSKLGVWKPNPLMFTTAIDEIDVRPEEVLFIDYSIKNVRGAIELGINSILIIRDNNLHTKESSIDIVNNLKDIYYLMIK